MLLVLALASIVPAADGVKFFEGSFDAALKEASAKGRPIFLDFYTEW